MAQKGKAFFSDDDFDNEKGDAELLQYDEEEATRDLTNVASLPSTAKHSTALRKSETGAEYLPVPVGGLNVYFNRHVGAQKSRKRTLIAMDPDARGKTALNILKFGEDEKYKPFLLMLEHGIPLAAVWDRCAEVGLDPSKLLDDAGGPAVHQKVRDPVREEEEALELFAKRSQEEATWRAHRTDWQLMQRGSVRTADTPLLPRTTGLLQQQRVERAAQAVHAEKREAQAAEGHRIFVPVRDDINRVTSLDRQVGKMRRNFPQVYSSRPLAYKATAGTDVALSGALGMPQDVWGNARPPKSYAESEFWREVGKGHARGLVGTTGAAVGAGGFSLQSFNRVPITWRTEKEIADEWNKKISV